MNRGNRSQKCGTYGRQCAVARRTRLSLICISACAFLIPTVVTQNANAYPPRQPMTLTTDQKLLQAKTGQALFIVRNTCPAAARVLINGLGYKAINASRGYGSFTFSPTKPGRYKVTVKSCKEEVSDLIYAPGVAGVPQKHVVPRKLTLYAKYVPPGTLVTFLLGGKRLPAVPPVAASATGTASVNLPVRTLKLGKNSVTFLVGTSIKISGQIVGILPL